MTSAWTGNCPYMQKLQGVVRPGAPDGNPAGLPRDEERHMAQVALIGKGKSARR
ncbi:MAG: hypothetical protein ACKVON_00045 [Beijerinckiaceae bacterium]